MSFDLAPRAAVVSLRGQALAEDERALFRRRPPAGFILFSRNCVDPQQLAALTSDLRELQPGRYVPILVDQEGGRVMRLAPPHWPALPSAGRVGELATRDLGVAVEAATCVGRAIGEELALVGIDIDCAPCLDVARPETTVAIGDRAFSADPELVGRLGLAFMAGLQNAGVLPVIKHLPGHGRAKVDSHDLLPVVSASQAELEAHDLVPFRTCAAAPLAITAHVVFSAIDPDLPATHSPAVISRLIRGAIGFAGTLLTDDLGMRALSGHVAERAARALDAGCDIALHCSGDIGESEAVLAEVPELPSAVDDRLQRLLSTAAEQRQGTGLATTLARLEALLAAA